MPRDLQLCYSFFTSQLLLQFVYVLISKNIANSLRQTASFQEQEDGFVHLLAFGKQQKSTEQSQEIQNSRARQDSS